METPFSQRGPVPSWHNRPWWGASDNLKGSIAGILGIPHQMQNKTACSPRVSLRGLISVTEGLWEL